MAQIILTVPDPAVARIQAAFVEVFGWNVNMGITQTEFVRQRLIAFMKEITVRHERQAAVAATEATVVSDVNNINIS